MTRRNADTEQCPEEIRELVDRRLSDWVWEPLRGDASTRLYGRVRGAAGETLIVTYYPPDVREKLDRFLAIHAHLAPSVPVPEILDSCPSGVIQRDVGDTTLLSVLSSDPVRGRELYRAAIDHLVHLQSAGEPRERANQPFGRELFGTELAMTNEYYVRRLTGNRDAARELEPIFEALIDKLLSHPYVPCHRDYHGENIHVLDGKLWIIDFQDMRLGPDTYDLASLLRDRGVARILGKEAEEDLLRYYARQLGGEPEIETRYLETLLQRTIKIIGTFARQSVERQRHHYLSYIPAALDTIRECVAGLPAYSDLLDLFPTTLDQPRFDQPLGETS